ncbi:FMN reductase [Streptomyces sp. GMY02]|uniref:FMN reductase n=1 Tax=Streptomyces sp. GMY02 TaxID=1333528 RepID=UPI001C2CC18C|nr:FMN reductase [Streptomyces sp. GMY02]QXE35703.1 FMN reductase [Streptomyces sp. GMY02]
MGALKLVAVSAGLSRPSSTRLLADRLAEATVRGLAAADREVEVEIVELRELAVDIAHHLVTGFPSPALGASLDRVTGADGLIVVTPVFAASYSGLFKSFFDLVEPDALAGTPVLLAATGGTARHSLVLEHALRPLFTYLHALPLPTAVYAATDDWGAGADTYGGGLPTRIERAGAEFGRLVGAVRGEERSRTGASGPDEPAEAKVVPFEELLGRPA